MRRKLAMLLATALAGGMIALGGTTPAHACHHIYIADDPIYDWACSTIHTVPDPQQTIDHYANVVFDTVHYAYCTVSPRC